jgi:hypothetical protein
MTLQRLIITFKAEQLILHTLYKTQDGPGPNTKARARVVTELARSGLTPAAPRPFAVIYEEHPEKSFDGDPDEGCGRCGRALWCVIEIVYDSPGDTEGGGA